MHGLEWIRFLVMNEKWQKWLQRAQDGGGGLPKKDVFSFHYYKNGVHFIHLNHYGTLKVK
jgi:hypothetical protein